MEGATRTADLGKGGVRREWREEKGEVARCLWEREGRGERGVRWERGEEREASTRPLLPRGTNLPNMICKTLNTS